MSEPQGATFLGIRFHAMSIDEASADILAQADRPFRYVVTPNVHHMVRLLDERTGMYPFYLAAWRVLCDSRVLSRLARLQGIVLPVITGSDLTAHLLSYAAKHRMTVAVVGPSDADCAKLIEKYPGLAVVCHTPVHGFMSLEPDAARAVAVVVEAKSPITFLAVGMPQQEQLARRIMDEPGAHGVGLCIGASIDFLTGKQTRAPLWIQRAGIEWLHRLLTNPVRLAPRYLIECPKIFYFMLIEPKNH